MICGTAMAARQALAAGLPERLILRSSGMIVRPEFYRTSEMSRAIERQRLGLDPDRSTGLVMFGGFGSHRMELIARRIAEAKLATQLIFLCGHNQKLAAQIAAMRLPFKHHIVGFTDQVPYFMRLADYFVGKPGPGGLSEALVMGLPMVVPTRSEKLPMRWECLSRWCRRSIAVPKCVCVEHWSGVQVNLSRCPFCFIVLARDTRDWVSLSLFWDCMDVGCLSNEREGKL